MRSKMFWGIFFIALGLLMLINYVLGINLPIFRVLLSIAVIYFGFNLLFGSFGLKTKVVASDNQAIFSKSKFSYSKNESHKSDFQTVFGNSELDLKDVDISSGNKKIELDNVFGQTNLYLSKSTPFVIQSSVVFGKVSLPNKNFSAMGEWTYESENFTKDQPYLLIEANVVFGDLKVNIE